ncbi:deoxyhypusine monooxygenase [Malassezia cuniculi]|uniref:Deoxyhypusine hydroxylase n=1 Tax=Malassezia cuniculi TaxID=948313 RepID=A0AAF0EPH5_9BASI|nr:deoxyhypusine monooxygenase [Malassezia cuniculi]
MPPSLDALEASLLNASGNVKLDARFRTLFTLKGLGMAEENRMRVIEIISKGFTDDSALLKHELAYVLGQLQDVRAIPKLESVLSDTEEHAMVRHEAAEALGAISSPTALPVLRKFLEDSDVSVRETCDLAVRKIELDNSDTGRKEAEIKAHQDAHGDARAAAAHAVPPIDPAPAFVQVKAADDAQPEVENVYTLEKVPYFRSILLDEKRSLFDRYRAMFSLRNIVQRGGEAAAVPAIEALAASLKDSSALFRHEICFVFGELCHPACIAAMTKVLDDPSEHEMVRHEAAEALGGVLEESEDGPSAHEQVVATLRRWADDESAPRVVRESCIVALDEIAYNNDPTQFQRIDTVDL